MESPPAGITVNLVDEANMYEWKVLMDGPEGSPYHVCLPRKQKLCLEVSVALITSGHVHAVELAFVIPH
jgi:hypothetical protein